MVHFPIPIKWKCNCSHEEGLGGGMKAWIETPPISRAAHPPFLSPSFQKVNFPSASKSPLSDNEARSIFIYKGHVGEKKYIV